VETTNLMQARAKFCEVFELKFVSFVHKTVPRYLSVVQVLLSFAAHQTFIVFYLFVGVNG